ncbi:hypothetical protein L7F22_020213 [Adiantum nelumboides]|nr:hypothetical protein [Adiantum nelumboides]
MLGKGKMSSVQDVAPWVDFLLKQQAVKGVYFGARGLVDMPTRDALLEMSPLFFNTQMTHVLPWALTKDYQSLIRHKCSVWVEVVDFPRTWRNFLPLLVAQLGKVICSPKLHANTNRFCVLWDTDIPTPAGIAIDYGDSVVGKRPFKLKWGEFANSCFHCGKFGHMQSECPEQKLQPPPSVVPSTQSPPPVKSFLEAQPKGALSSTLTVGANKGKQKKLQSNSLLTSLNAKEVGNEQLSSSQPWMVPKKSVKARPLASSRNYVLSLKNVVQTKLPCNDNTSLAEAWDKVVRSYKEVLAGEASTLQDVTLLNLPRPDYNTSPHVPPADEDVPMGTYT